MATSGHEGAVTVGEVSSGGEMSSGDEVEEVAGAIFVLMDTDGDGKAHTHTNAHTMHLLCTHTTLGPEAQR